jgi:hypothetical protein
MKIFRLFPGFLLSLLLSINLNAQLLLDWNEEWSYYKGIAEPSGTSPHWNEPEFDAAGWSNGIAPFQYGKGEAGTLLTDMPGNYSTFYVRKEFEVSDINEIDQLVISVDFDDGFALWINGEFLLKHNAPGDLSFDQFATNLHEAGEYEVYVLKGDELNLVNGTNVVAVQGFNISHSSSDFFLDARVQGMKTLPEAEPVSIDFSSGFFNQTFTARINASQLGDTIKYTLDGSDPRYSTTTLTGYSPVDVFVDPDSNLGGRGKTGGVVLRASRFQAGFEPSKPITRNYIFINQVINQRHPGGGWPVSNINGQVIDLQMDSRITSDARYKDVMDDVMLDIPSVMITTDPSNLFDPQTGIYVNAKYRGRDWERPANIELIHPDGKPGFNVDAGLRIRGGWSRHPEFAKHAFRVFFRSIYGPGRLRFPLFDEEGTDRYDKIDFRTSQNYSWSKGGSEGVHNTMNRDVFSRDVQRDMGHPYTRSRYYHLYINGLYWGVFQTQERAEAAFAESYLGGREENYDVVKVDVGDNWNLYEIEATDGNTDAWEVIWNMCQQGFSTNVNYFKLLGLNASGEEDTSLNVWVDIDNLIDYMIIIFYGGNFDAPVSKFSNNYNPNNFFAIYNRENHRQGFKFMIHDAEHSLLTDPVGPGVGIQENRVNINMNVTSFGKFHPQWLHHRLTANMEYRMRFVDRVYLHFHRKGIFHPDTNVIRFRKTADQLQLAIIGESARWGDMGVSTPRTKHDDWLPAVNRVIYDYFPHRTDIVINQLLDENLFVTLKAPIVKLSGENVINQQVMRTFDDLSVTLENPNSNGNIFYTIDGTDPRAIGGALSGSAIAGGNSAIVEITPGTVLKARTRYVNFWSPLHDVYFQDASIFEYLKVTELHYNPMDQDTINGQLFEFIELKNTGKTTLNLSGLSFTEGIYFTFPDGTSLDPKQFEVVASNKDAFNSFYEIPTDFEYTGRLSNSGEKIVLKTAGDDVVISFTYSDMAPWPTEPDGGGYSLVSVERNPTGDPNYHDYWTVSKNLNGSPFADDDSSLFMVGLQQMIEGQGAASIDLNDVFAVQEGMLSTYSIVNENPASVQAVLNGNLLTLTPVKRGGTNIHITVTDGINVPYVSPFRVLVHPEAHRVSEGGYSFTQWAQTEPEYSYPENMLFLQSNMIDPGENYPLLFPYYIAPDDYHANDQGSIGFPYALTGRTRINALGDQGISFINTGRQRDLGGAVLALDTRNANNLQLRWTAGTILQNERVYALRLQYRTSIHDKFKDLLIDGNIQEYKALVSGHAIILGFVDLPQDLLNREYVQLLWRYYHVSGTSGPRAELRLDNIQVNATVGIDETIIEDLTIYSAGSKIFVNRHNADRATLRVFNLMGQELLRIPVENAGTSIFDTQLSTGIYILRLESSNRVTSKKVLISGQ